MRKNVLYLIVIMLIGLFNVGVVNAAYIKESNPSATYESDRIILPNGSESILGENHIPLFLNGRIITEHKVLIRENRSLVPVRLVSEELGATVNWNQKTKEITILKSNKKIKLSIDSKVAMINGTKTSLDYPAIVHNSTTYVPLRFVAESLDSTVEYSSWKSSGNKYYYDTTMPVSSEKTLVRTLSNIIIDEKYEFTNGISVDEAKKKVQKACLEGLGNFSTKIKEGLKDSSSLDQELKMIETEINRMLYIGEISRFYKFTIGPYDILFDRINSKMFFIIHGSSIKIKEFDANDPALYINVFIVG